MYIAIHPKDNRVLYAGTNQNRLLKTDNIG